uniref:Endonuclease/exonuclease/phosphatase domain-containing protein n=1 Tax=Micrurus spixii TaxID=129469 RepID=A0A2D4LM94_9SAUR
MSASQIYKDNECRILIVETILNKKCVMLVGIYALNTRLEQFYKKFYNIQCDNICIMGDFNAITNQKQGIRKTLPKIFFKMAEELGIRGIWRERNQKRNRYTCYSSRHQSWSRSDMIWMSIKLQQEVEEAEIDGLIIIH